MVKRLLMVVPLMATVACGSSSPENFVETSTRLSCRYVKKCEEDQWEEAGYDNVRDCVNTTLDAEVPSFDGGTTTFRDLFVEGCTDFDKSAARECLAAMRKAKRECDPEAVNTDQQEACQKVCGDPAMSELFRDPTNQELFFELAAEMSLDEDYEDYEEDDASLRWSTMDETDEAPVQ